MLPVAMVVLTYLGAFFRSRNDLGFEVAALRLQLIVLKRKCPRPPTAQDGSHLLGGASPIVVSVERSSDHRSARNCRRLASRRLSAVLALAISRSQTRPTNHHSGDSPADPSHGATKSRLGRPKNPWRASETGI